MCCFVQFYTEIQFCFQNVGNPTKVGRMASLHLKYMDVPAVHADLVLLWEERLGARGEHLNAVLTDDPLTVWVSVGQRMKSIRIFLRDWSLIMGRGGYKTGGGHVKFYPYKKGGGGAEKVLAMLKWGHNKFYDSFYTVAWSFSHIEGGGTKCFHSLKEGSNKFYPVLMGGGA